MHTTEAAPHGVPAHAGRVTAPPGPGPGRMLRIWTLAVCACVLGPLSARAAVVRVEVESRTPVLGGRPFGDAGAYERLVGRIYFSFDPDDPHNRAIVDLAGAPRNDEGRVEAWTEFMVFQPVDPTLRRGIGWVEVSNRGGKAGLRYFQAAQADPNPRNEEHFGDGLLMRQGLTLIWIGWQHDVPDREGLLRLVVPTVTQNGGPILGQVRADWTVEAPVTTLGLGHRGHLPYRVADPQDPSNRLTVRDSREGEREVIPTDQWRFLQDPDGGGYLDIGVDGGFEAGRIYELVYEARDPVVVGLGLAAIRDVASYAKHDLESLFPVHQAIAFGVSQTGRFLRHFLYQGFNTDEAGQKVFDGMLIHTAGGGRGSFNHRFAQPSRDAHRYSAFFYPTDLFPFSSRGQSDPLTGWEGGLLDQTPESDRPLTFFTNTGYEYWGRAASLIHTSPDGNEDVEPLDTERIYHLSGGQHSVGRYPPDPAQLLPGTRAYRGNPLDFLVTLRALAVRLVEWVDDGTEPPPSAYPRVSRGTLVPVAGLAFPGIPGVDAPTVAHVAYRADYGPRFVTDGIVDVQPPRLGEAYPSLVPQVDGLGNEISGVRALELRVPLATFAPWNLRAGFAGGVEELTDFTGTYIPLPPTDEAADDEGDPRPSVEALYGSKDAFLTRARAAARDLVLEGFLLSEDLPRVLSRADDHWDRVTGARDPGP